MPDGRIEGSRCENEARWGIEHDQLSFFHADGRPSTQFDSHHRQDHQEVHSRPFLLEPSRQRHQLREAAPVIDMTLARALVPELLGEDERAIELRTTRRVMQALRDRGISSAAWPTAIPRTAR